jgi:uncharacterized protein (DUF2336 family)
VLARSPLFIDAELVDLVATSSCELQAAIAARAPLESTVAAAIAEVGSAEACLIVVENPYAEIAPTSFDRIVTRFGRLGAIREALFARDDLPIAARHVLMTQLSSLLADFVVERQWLGRNRADQVVRDACERGTVAIAALAPNADTTPVVRQLRDNGQLTAGFVLRAVLSGNVAMFEDVLAELSELPLGRVQALLHDRGSAGFRAIYEKAGMPTSVYVAFREAVAALRDVEDGEYATSSRLKRAVVERVLARCENADIGDIEPLLILLRRYAAEAAREDARLYCEELVADDRRSAADREAA